MQLKNIFSRRPLQSVILLELPWKNAQTTGAVWVGEWIWGSHTVVRLTLCPPAQCFGNAKCPWKVQKGTDTREPNSSWTSQQWGFAALLLLLQFIQGLTGGTQILISSQSPPITRIWLGTQGKWGASVSKWRGNWGIKQHRTVPFVSLGYDKEDEDSLCSPQMMF